MAARRFKAVIENADRGGMFITIPFDVEKVFGSKRPKVLATFEGEPYRGTLMRMGTEAYLLGIRKDIRDKIGKGVGDTITVTIEEDLQPRVVTVPADVKKAMRADASSLEFFESLSFTHQREYIEWIESAKREETRLARIEKMMEMLRERKRSR